MSTGYTITLTGEGETQARLMKFGPSPGLSRVMGEAASAATKEWLMRMDGTRANQMGGTRTHFYWQAAQNTRHEATADGAEVVIDKLGLRQRWLGGEIRAVNGKYLTIPARAEAYGKRARDMGDLSFIKFKSGAAALVKDDISETVTDSGYSRRSAAKGQRKSRKKGIGAVMFWLVPSVYQRPDPTVLPSPAYLLNAVTPRAGAYLGGFNL